MIDLPVGMAAWAQPLSVLPDDLALMLAPWVGRLSIAIGPLAHTQRQQSGEPDGYSGLARRGSYERLVTTEWGVADLFPEEFLRRAATGEHLFLDLARQEPRGGQRTIAIVSAGPSQMGAPRLAHVAALIVLARRAAAAGATFSWGVLEDDLFRLHEGLDEGSISRLLAARTAVAAEHDALTRWSSVLGDDKTRDFWFVGDDDDGARCAALGASRIVVRDVLSPSARLLEIDVERRTQNAKLHLELPDPDLCARLLRDPFGRAEGGGARVAQSMGKATEVRFAPGARRLIIRLDDGSYETWPLPSSPRDKVGAPRRWSPPKGYSVVAVGIGKRALLAAIATKADVTALHLCYADNHRLRVSLPLHAVDALAKAFETGEPPIGTVGLVSMKEHARTDLVIDVCGYLLVIPGFSLWPAATSHPLMAMPFAPGENQPAVATAFFRSAVVWAERHEPDIHVFEANASGVQRVATLGAREQPEVMFGHSSPPVASWGAVAVAWDAEHRRVAAPKLTPTSVRALLPVVGVCVRDGVPGLLTKPHPHRLVWRIGEGRELLPVSSVPIVTVTVCPSHPNVAWVTSEGEVVIYSMEQHAVLMRRRPGEPTK